MDAKTKSLLRKFLVIAMLIIAAAIAFWLFQNAKNQTVAVGDQSVSTSSSKSIVPRTENVAVTTLKTATQQPVSQKSSSNRSKHPAWPAHGTPIDTAIADLQSLADGGDTDAMLMLGSYLADCGRADRDNDDAIRQHVIDEMLRREQISPNGQPYTNELDAIAGTTASRIAVRDQCAKIDTDRAAHWLDWITRAAQAGGSNAMIFYAQHAFEDFHDRDQLLNNFDEVTRRRALAATYLQQALEQHDCNALAQLEWAYAGERGMGAIFAPDPISAYAYATARHQWEIQNRPQDPNDDGGWARFLADRAKTLNADQILAAQTRGAAIFERYCQGVGE